MIERVFIRFMSLLIFIVLVVIIGCGGVSKISKNESAVPLKTVDAETKATKWNQHEGTEASLTDGKYPAIDKEATAFVLKEKGILGIVLTEPTSVKSVNIFVGEDEPGLILKGYLGGKLDLEMGSRDPEGEIVLNIEMMEVPKNDWVVIDFQGKKVDNFELYNWGTATYYELIVVPTDP